MHRRAGFAVVYVCLIVGTVAASATAPLPVRDSSTYSESSVPLQPWYCKYLNIIL